MKGRTVDNMADARRPSPRPAGLFETARSATGAAFWRCCFSCWHGARSRLHGPDAHRRCRQTSGLTSTARPPSPPTWFCQTPHAAQTPGSGQNLAGRSRTSSTGPWTSMFDEDDASRKEHPARPKASPSSDDWPDLLRTHPLPSGRSTRQIQRIAGLPLRTRPNADRPAYRGEDGESSPLLRRHGARPGWGRRIPVACPAGAVRPVESIHAAQQVRGLVGGC